MPSPPPLPTLPRAPPSTPPPPPWSRQAHRCRCAPPTASPPHPSPLHLPGSTPTTRRQSTPPPRLTLSSSLPSPSPSLSPVPSLPMTSKPLPSASPPPTTSAASTPPLLATTFLDSSPPSPTLSVAIGSPIPLTPSRHGCACPRPSPGAPYFSINAAGNIAIRPHGTATLPYQEIDLMMAIRKAIDPKPTDEPSKPPTHEVSGPPLPLASPYCSSSPPS